MLQIDDAASLVLYVACLCLMLHNKQRKQPQSVTALVNQIGALLSICKSRVDILHTLSAKYTKCTAQAVLSSHLFFPFTKCISGIQTAAKTMYTGSYSDCLLRRHFCKAELFHGNLQISCVHGAFFSFM